MNRIFQLCLLMIGFFGLSSCTETGSGGSTQTQYSVIGKVSAIAEEGVVTVEERYYNDEGIPETRTLAEAKISDGWFELIGEVNAPTMVKIVIEGKGSPEDGYPLLDSAVAVIEPGAQLVVAHYGRAVGSYVEGTGTHAELVSSWQFSTPYVNARNRYSYLLDTGAAIGIRVTEAKAIASGEMEQAVDGEPLSDVEMTALDEERKQLVEQAWSTYQELDQIRKDGLIELTKSNDPSKALLAIELMEHLGTSEENLIRLGELAELLDAETVANRVKPKQNRLVLLLERKKNDEGLAAGTMAPDFSTQNLQGEEVSLYQLIADKDVVLLDFWASWCAPCIQTFPKLKELYAEYKDQGFEIVMVSIDDTNEEWAEASEEHELAWLDLGDISEDMGPIALAYGVQGIPKGFLLDSTGKIVARDLTTDKLEEFLKEQFNADSDV